MRAMNIDHITTIAEPSFAEHKAKGSRFLAFAYPIACADDIKPLLAKLHDEHHKAVHWCYAYRLGADGTQFRANDDGEPSGSAGMPILRQIDSAGVSDVAVIVVRYFGGTLLGVPGLIQAYKQSAAAALQAAARLEKPILCVWDLRFAYDKTSEVMRLIKRAEAQIVHQQMDMQVGLRIAVPKSRADGLMQQLNDKHWLSCVAADE